MPPKKKKTNHSFFHKFLKCLNPQALFFWSVTNVTQIFFLIINFAQTKIMSILETIKQPWPWYIAGPLIGLTVPALLILGNKTFGISSNLRHICAACFPSNLPFFQYNWKKEIWNLFFVIGIFIGGIVAYTFLTNPNVITINPNLRTELATYGISNIAGMMPEEIFSWQSLATLRGFLIIAIGGLLIGFGSRYAGGCTSGHAISGLSNLQLASLIATCCFFVGGLVVANFLLPYLLSL